MRRHPNRFRVVVDLLGRGGFARRDMSNLRRSRRDPANIGRNAIYRETLAAPARLPVTDFSILTTKTLNRSRRFCAPVCAKSWTNRSCYFCNNLHHFKVQEIGLHETEPHERAPPKSTTY